MRFDIFCKRSIERKYKLTRKVLETLSFASPRLVRLNPISILTKSDLVLRDTDLSKKLKDVDVNFTITTLDEKWKSLIEPYSPTVKKRLEAMRQLSNEAISVFALMGPYWPIFTDPEALFKNFKEAGVSHIFTESFNTTGGNWTGVEYVLRRHYPQLLPQMREIFFNKKKFYDFYNQTEKEIRQLSKKYQIPVTIHFGLGHAAKFKN